MRKLLKSFLRSIINKISLTSRVTDEVFCCIEDNQSFLIQYQAFCTRYGKATTNREMGRLIKELLGLDNTGVGSPRSSLIKTFTLH